MPEKITAKLAAASRRKFRIRFFNRRELAIAFLPLCVFFVLAIGVAFYFVQPAPPKKIVMASGKQEGRYGYYAKLYQAFLAKNGVPFIWLDTARIRSTGWVPTMTIREAVESTVDYLVDNDWILDRFEQRV